MIHNFNKSERFSTIDKLPDFRSEEDKQNSPLSIFQHDLPDIAFAEKLAEEVINISGAWVKVYQREVHRLDDNFNDELDTWDENTKYTYHNPEYMKAFFKIEPFVVSATKFGLDADISLQITFSRAILYKMTGDRLLLPGDIISVPYNLSPKLKLMMFRVITPLNTGNFRYRWLYYQVNTKLLLGDKAAVPRVK